MMVVFDGAGCGHRWNGSVVVMTVAVMVGVGSRPRWW